MTKLFDHVLVAGVWLSVATMFYTWWPDIMFWFHKY